MFPVFDVWSSLSAPSMKKEMRLDLLRSPKCHPRRPGRSQHEADHRHLAEPGHVTPRDATSPNGRAAKRNGFKVPSHLELGCFISDTNY